MITEDYVSFETTKLLKEKGFDELCHGYFRKDNPNNLVKLAQSANWNDEPFFTSRPTLQMAMKWLREVHNLHIKSDRASKYWNYTIRKLCPFGTKDLSYDVDFNTNEQACETAIRYCLKNLL